jgi:hypothetical protein
MKKILAFILALGLSAPLVAQAQSVSLTGTITGNQAAVVTLSPGQSNAAVALTGTFTSGTIDFLVSNDGVNYFASPADTTISATADGLFNVTVASAKFLEILGVSVVGSVNYNISATAAVAPKGAGTGGAVSCTVGTCSVNVGQINGAAIGSATAAGTPASGNILTVQGNASGVPIPVAANTAAPCTSGTCTSTVVQPTAANLNATVTQGTAANLNANVSQATAANLNVTSQANIANFAAGATSTARGIPSQRLFPTNTSGGGCDGVNLTSGTQIVKQSSVTVLGSGTTVQLVPLVAGTIIHVCSISVSSGVLTTNGGMGIVAGTGTLCATSNIGLWSTNLISTTLTSVGDGENGLIDTPSGSALCVTTAAFVSTLSPLLDITYAQY